MEKYRIHNEEACIPREAYNRACDEVKRLRALWQTANEGLSSLTEENERLRERLDRCKSVKRQQATRVAELEQENEKLRIDNGIRLTAAKERARLIEQENEHLRAILDECGSKGERLVEENERLRDAIQASPVTLRAENERLRGEKEYLEELLHAERATGDRRRCPEVHTYGDDEPDCPTCGAAMWR